MIILVVGLVMPRLGDGPAWAAQPSSEWRTYANADDVWALDFEDQRVVWAATRGGGVVRWDLTDLDHPQARQYLFPQDGLAGNMVRDVVVDSRGNKWFATERGLSRLTASGQWQTYTRATTDGKLPSNVITALALKRDELWVGTQQVYNSSTRRWEGGGFAQLDLGVEPPVVRQAWNADDQPDLVPSNNITDLAVDPANGDIWITMRSDEQNVEPTPERPNQYFRTRPGGITVVHTQGTASVEKFQRSPSGGGWPRYDSLLTVAVDQQGIKWFGSGDLDGGGNGLYALRGNTAASARWKWFASSDVALPSGATPVTDMPLGAAQIVHLAVGPDNSVWVGMANGDANVDGGEGLGVCRLTWDRAFDAATRPVCEEVYGVFESGDHYVPGNLVRAIRFSADGQLRLFGTSGRLPARASTDYAQGADGHGLAVQRVSGPGDALLTTLVTGARGLTSASLGLTPSSNHISALALDADNRLWVSYAYPLALGADAWRGQGLDHFTPAGGWQHEGYAPLGFTSRAVSAVAFDNQQRLWVGLLREQLPTGDYANGGVALRNTEGVWQVFQAENGAPSNSVSALVAAGSQVWVGTGTRSPSAHGAADLARGLGRFDSGSMQWGAPLRTPTLLGDEITDLSVGGGQVWAATTSARRPGAVNPPGGLTSIQGTTVVNIPANQNGLMLSNSDSRAVLAAPDGVLWAGGYFTVSNEDPVLSDAVINWRFLGETRWQSRRFPDDGWVSAIAYRPTGAGSVWVGTSRGGQGVEDFPTFVFPPSLGGNRYQAQGGLRVYTGGVWHEWTPANTPLVSGHITALAVDGDGAVWVGTTLGLMRYTGPGPLDARVPRLWLPLLENRR